MKEKTAMMEAFDHLKLWIDSGLSIDNWFKNYEASHLKKEKEQIMEAFNVGENFSDEYFNPTTYTKVSVMENYYNETYKQD